MGIVASFRRAFAAAVSRRPGPSQRIPEAAPILSELRKVLDKWIAETNDQGAKPEAQSTLTRANRQSTGKRARRFKERGLPEDPTPEQHLEYWEKTLLKNTK